MIVQNQLLLGLIIHTKAKLIVECNGLSKVDCRKIASDMICHFLLRTLNHLPQPTTTQKHHGNKNNHKQNTQNIWNT